MKNNIITLQKTEILKKAHSILGNKWKGKNNNENFAKLYYTIDGHATIYHNNQKFDLKPGYLYLIPPNSQMRYKCIKRCEIIWFHFNIFLNNDIDLFNNDSFTFIYGSNDSDTVYYKMQQLLNLSDNSDIFSQLKSQSLLLDLISNFLRFEYYNNRYIIQKEKNDTRFTPVFEYINSHIGSKITIGELAKIAAYEKTYFSTLFKKKFSISPISYLQNCRIQKAQSLLRNTNMKLLAIADELGFNDAFHFSKTFKKITSKNPSEFRKKYLSKIP